MNLLPQDAIDLRALSADSERANGGFDLKNITTFGIRPEHLRLESQGLPLQLVSVEMLGAERLLYTVCGQGTGPHSEPNLIVRIPEGQACPAVGETLHVKALAGKLHGFDAQGKRVVASF